MGFNKRIFNIEMFANAYKRSPEKAISNVIGKTDGFIFQDDLSKQIVDLYFSGEERRANLIIEDYVLRISTKTS
jgi:hypothetical protein